MAFETYGVNSSTKSEKKSDVDWNKLNEFVVETCNLQERETLVGYVSAIVDLGTQKLPDAEYVSDVDPDDEADFMDDNPGVYFKDGFDPDTRKPARMKCVPQKDQQCISLAVDFPDIIVDKGQFFGESNPKPLRLWMGGTFYSQANGMVVARPTPLKVVNLDKERKTKKWSFSPLHLCYKMAVAAKLIKAGECFLPSQIDELLGKAFQFEAQVFFKEGKDKKKYYTEYIKFVGGLGRGQSEPELVTEPVLIQFNAKNKPEHLKEIRSHVVNTMKMATNFEGSPIQSQLEALYNNSESDESTEDDTPPAKQEKKPSKVKETPKKVEEPVDDEFDPDSLPF